MRVIGAVIAALLLMSSSLMAEDVVGIRGAFCDTPEQVASLLNHAANLEPALAIEEVNKENGSENVCGRLSVLGIVGEKKAEMTTKDGTFSIVSVKVVGVFNQGMVIPMSRPVEQYMALKVKKDPGA
jgi:hypothetical protein